MTAQLGRFTVRDVNMWDVVDIFTLFSNSRTVRYMGVPQLRDAYDAAKLVERYQSGPTRWLSVLDGIKFLGVVGLEVQGHQATITIAFNGTKEARGVGREFSVPFVQWIFTHPHVWRVWAYVHVDNKPAQRVLRRMGAHCEGRLRRFAFFPNVSEEPQDVYVYSIVR